MSNCIELNRYIVVFTHSEGNGWAIVNAMSENGAQKVFKNQTKFTNTKVKGVKELRYFGDNIELVYEGGLNVLERAIPEIVKEFSNSYENLYELIKDLSLETKEEIQEVISYIQNTYTKKEVDTKITEAEKVSEAYTDAKIDDVLGADAAIVDVISGIREAIKDGNTATGILSAIANNKVAIDENTTEIAKKANKTELPTKVSDLTNDTGFITSSALQGYATEQYVDNIVGNIDTALATIIGE